MNDIARVISKLELQRSNIDRAIAALKGLSQGETPAASSKIPAAAPAKPAKKKRRLSPEGRARIAAAVKKYWADKKAAAKKK